MYRLILSSILFLFIIQANSQDLKFSKEDFLRDYRMGYKTEYKGKVYIFREAPFNEYFLEVFDPDNLSITQRSLVVSKSKGAAVVNPTHTFERFLNFNGNLYLLFEFINKKKSEFGFVAYKINENGTVNQHRHVLYSGKAEKVKKHGYFITRASKNGQYFYLRHSKQKKGLLFNKDLNKGEEVSYPYKKEGKNHKISLSKLLDDGTFLYIVWAKNEDNQTKKIAFYKTEKNGGEVKKEVFDFGEEFVNTFNIKFSNEGDKLYVAGYFGLGFYVGRIDLEEFKVDYLTLDEMSTEVRYKIDDEPDAVDAGSINKGLLFQQFYINKDGSCSFIMEKTHWLLKLKGEDGEGIPRYYSNDIVTVNVDSTGKIVKINCIQKCQVEKERWTSFQSFISLNKDGVMSIIYVAHKEDPEKKLRWYKTGELYETRVNSNGDMKTRVLTNGISDGFVLAPRRAILNADNKVVVPFMSSNYQKNRLWGKTVKVKYGRFQF